MWTDDVRANANNKGEAYFALMCWNGATLPKAPFFSLIAELHLELELAPVDFEACNHKGISVWSDV